MNDPDQFLPEQIRTSFSELEGRVHEKLRELLWVQYPTEKTLNVGPDQDKISDLSALFIIDGLRRCGFMFTERQT